MAAAAAVQVAALPTAVTPATPSSSSISPSTPSYTLISTPEDLSLVLDKLLPLPTSPPSLYIDLEGINLSRYGTISILTIYASPLDHTYLIDIHTLRGKAFTTPSAVAPSATLKSILESPTIPVVLFDVRNDNDALANLYNVRMQCAKDVQLMELACRPINSKKRFLNGLAKVIKAYGGMSQAEWKVWEETKIEGVKLFAPEKGGSYEVFNERPLREEVGRYCVQDVRFLRDLWVLFDNRLSSYSMRWWRVMVEEEVGKRLALCDDPRYDPKGRQRALGPAGWS
ncbi:hypothetical protein ABW19_dt0203816 [Dactylella cylindrospora]|nr:hypothetical protein ABW19_dt0203816 [Dactylella cylindrospora]